MNRDASTSTIGREEERKPLMKAYMFQRRVLLGCSVLMVLSLIVWIVAIATDRWIIISGFGGIFIPETRRFFMSSNSGLWRYCRFTITPNALPNSDVIRNFTSIAYQTTAAVNEAKKNASRLDFIQEYSELDVDLTCNFTDDAKKRMFADWVRGHDGTVKKYFQDHILTTDEARNNLISINTKPIPINPVDVENVIKNGIFGRALQKVMVNSTSYYFVIPEQAQAVIFNGWNEQPYVPKLFWPFARDLGIPAFVLNENRFILQLVPPRPPTKGRIANGYEYVPNRRCKYIDMLANIKMLHGDPGFDATLMDYIRTQASFACITVFVMCLGAVFSFYTFMNPRYMFKRLAGGIHLVSASTALVVLQVLFSSVDYTKDNLFYSFPDGAELKYGYGVYLSWFTFGVNLMCGIMFMWYSGKKKGNKAPTDEVAMADEPTIMGR